MASSMKLFKPSNSYGANKTNYYESQQEYSSQSNYVDTPWARPSYDNQAQENHMGRSMHGGKSGAYGHASANKSTNYYAQAQSAQPSTALNVVQSAHVVETMQSQESNKGQQWGVDSPKYSSPTRLSRSEFGLHQEEYTTGESDHGWAKKPNYVSGGAQTSQYGLAREEQGWASPTMGSKQGVIVHEEEHVIEKVESKLVNKPTQLSSPIHANQYGQSMYKEQEAEAYNYSEGGVERAWASKPNKYLGPTQSSNSMQTMYNENGRDGWGDNSGKHPGLIHINNTTPGVHKENPMMGKMDQGWVNSKFSGPQSNHLNMGMYQQGHMMSEMGHEAHLPTNDSGLIKTNNSGLKMYKDERIVEKSDHILVNPPVQLPGPIQGNQYGQSTYSGNSANGSWAKQPAKYSSSNQLGYSSHDGFGPSQGNRPNHGLAEIGFGPSQVNQSAHGVAQNRFTEAHGVAQNGFGASQVNQSSHGVSQNGYGAAQANYSSHSVGQNRFESAQGNHSAYGAAQNGFTASQVNHSTVSAHGVGKKGFGLTQDNHSAYGVAQSGFGSAHGAFNYHDNEEADDEGVHEIMDEILAKYPAHNVSGGPKPNIYGGPAQHGIVAQSSSNKFEMKNEVKAGYMVNMKNEYSHSTSSKKFEVNDHMNNGGLHNTCVESDDEYDF